MAFPEELAKIRRKLQTLEPTLLEMLTLARPTSILKEKLAQAEALIMEIPDECAYLATEWRGKLASWYKDYSAKLADFEPPPTAELAQTVLAATVAVANSKSDVQPMVSPPKPIAPPPAPVQSKAPSVPAPVAEVQSNTNTTTPVAAPITSAPYANGTVAESAPMTNGVITNGCVNGFGEDEDWGAAPSEQAPPPPPPAPKPVVQAPSQPTPTNTYQNPKQQHQHQQSYQQPQHQSNYRAEPQQHQPQQQQQQQSNQSQDYSQGPQEDVQLEQYLSTKEGIKAQLDEAFSIMRPITSFDVPEDVKKLTKLVAKADELLEPFWRDRDLQAAMLDKLATKLPQDKWAQFEAFIGDGIKSVRNMKRFLIRQLRTLYDALREKAEAEEANQQQQPAGGDGADKFCVYCKGVTHNVDSCIQIKYTLCFICLEDGHTQRRCPMAAQQQSSHHGGGGGSNAGGGW